jgi:DEAD/DEAH box helicase domain-containing protein
MLVQYLSMQDAENLFTVHAKAYAFSLIDPRNMNNGLAFTEWNYTVGQIADALYSQGSDFIQQDTMFGKWIPRKHNSHLTIYSGVATSDTQENKTNAAIADNCSLAGFIRGTYR